MPHTSHKKKQARTKRSTITDESGWTRITTTDSTQRQPRLVALRDKLEQRFEGHSYTTPACTAPAGKTLELVLDQYRRIEKRWLESESHAELQKCLTRAEVVQGVDRCLVFGTGSFTGLYRSWIDRGHVSMFQLAAFVDGVDIIEKRTGKRPVLYAQEPVYTDLDREFLERLGIAVLESPSGFREVTSSSFVYAPNAELNVTLRVLACDPAVAMVSTKLDMFWRNAKGEACTDAIVHLLDDGRVSDEEKEDKEGADGESRVHMHGKLLHEMAAEEKQRLRDLPRIRDELEVGLGICEGFKRDRERHFHNFIDAALEGRGTTNNDRADSSLVHCQSNFTDYAPDSRVQDALKAGNLDFDARVPIPISVFPSTYRSDATSAETTSTQVAGEVNLGAQASSRVGREDTRFSGKEEVDISVNQYRQQGRDNRADIRVFEEKSGYQRPTTNVDITETTRQDRQYYPAKERVNIDVTRQTYQNNQPTEFKDVNVDVAVNRGPEFQGDYLLERSNVQDQTYQTTFDRALETTLDVTERDYRRRVNPKYDIEYERRRPVRDADVVVQRETIRETTSDRPIRNKLDMGYYDDEGQYHSFRRGVERAVDRIVHPFSHHHHHHHEDVQQTNITVEERAGPSGIGEGVRESVRFVKPRSAGNVNTVTIPCQFIRIGDLLMLQGRPCQVIRISMSAQTGQYRYLGVDLFTKQLHEESSFVSNPEPSVVVQSMIGPVFKQYRILDLREDGLAVCMTETGDVKQGLQIVDQGNLYGKINRAFSEGRGSVRALVINDGGRELVVDYKIINCSRL